MRLGQKTKKLMQSGDSMKKNGVCTKMMVKKVIVNLYMPAALMEDMVVSNLESTCTDTI